MSNQRYLQVLRSQHKEHIRAIQDQQKKQIQAIYDYHLELLRIIEERERVSPTREDLTQILRQRELYTHKKVNELEKKNTDQETKHARMIVTLDKVVDRQENQLRFQKKKFQQEVKYMKEEMAEGGVEHTQEVKELKEREETNVKENEVLQVRSLENVKATKEVGVQTAEQREEQNVKKIEVGQVRGRENMKVMKEVVVQTAEQDAKQSWRKCF